MTYNINDAFIMEVEGLSILLRVLQERGHLIIGPTVKDDAIVYDRISQMTDLPIGWTDEQNGGSYRLKRRTDRAIFGYNNGPQSLKRFYFPPRQKLFDAQVVDEKITFNIVEDDVSYAFLGVRPCDLAAVKVQDLVFLGGNYKEQQYGGRRDRSFIVAVNCSQAANTCFCTSFNTGPQVSDGYDLALTEILENNIAHYFYVKIGSEHGQLIANLLPLSKAEATHIDAAEGVITNTTNQISRHLDTECLKDLLNNSYEHSHWESVAERCLGCANCTMVCPTCFCSRIEDVTDLTGEKTQRLREWDSCFTNDFSYIHGGSIRSSIKSQYRQWLTHKLSTWFAQFGTSGCIGCGRCITWCPVGIDLIEEVKHLRTKSVD